MKVNKFDDKYLFCTLTKRKVPNTESQAIKHTDGARYVKKMYEHWKAEMMKRRKSYLVEMIRNRRDIENGKIKKLKSARRLFKPKTDKRNVLFKGYPRRCKKQRIMRYARLIIMGLKKN